MAVARRHSEPEPESLADPSDRPLIGVVLVEDGREVVRYFVDEADADAAVAGQPAGEAGTLAGAWSDLEWEALASGLDRIRHDSVPTPPIDDL